MSEIFSSQLPPIKSGANIGLLGGSFDPPHTCHQLLALSFLALEPIDELWVIPCANHAFKGTLTDFAHRYAMCTLAFKRINTVRVLDVENHLNTPSYTIETINYILQALPSVHLHLGIGSDLVQNFDRWHGAEQIAQKVRVVIFERVSYPVKTIPPILAKARMHQGYALPDISSTGLREALRLQKPNDKEALVDREVARYIDEQGLYK